MRFGVRRQWVVRRGKVPYNPCDIGSSVAKSNDPETWGTLQDALEALRLGDFDGLGFEFGIFAPGTLRVSGIDLDHVIREDGSLEPFAAEIVELMDSYTEYSPSGTGLHILCETALEDIGRKKGINVPAGLKCTTTGVILRLQAKFSGSLRVWRSVRRSFRKFMSGILCWLHRHNLVSFRANHAQKFFLGQL